MLDVTITAPADVQAEETDAWDLAQMWAEFRAELEITGEQAKEAYRKLRRLIGYAGCWNWKREPWVPPERPEKLRGLRQYGPARVAIDTGKGAANVKLGSMFDGSGTMPLCAAMCGARPVWASEVEPYPVAVTKTHLPGMKHLGSVTDICGGNIEPVDIITFGSPCQDLSIAGKRAGLDGNRSGLFRQAIRIILEMLQATGWKYPRFVIWENVPGALSSNGGKDFETVLNELLRLTGTDQFVRQRGKWGGLRRVRSCGLPTCQCAILGSAPAQAQSIRLLRYWRTIRRQDTF